MKTSELVKALIEQLAAHGDIEVFVRDKEADQFTKMVQPVKTHRVQQMHGKRYSYLEVAKAKSMGYDPSAAVLGIVLG